MDYFLLYTLQTKSLPHCYIRITSQVWKEYISAQDYQQKKKKKKKKDLQDAKKISKWLVKSNAFYFSASLRKVPRKQSKKQQKTSVSFLIFL